MLDDSRRTLLSETDVAKTAKADLYLESTLEGQREN